eukprot:TRINITY_DN41485_c0_g1_i1.p1 TRINITY_DN41485_c0_g1~~TRINITY_DN41485_c0_g1_i1.p1  ORF type:complete len:828 (+),score=160.72 TRINITY_DN41485_c0_g1_i1:94-2577(+)
MKTASALKGGSTAATKPNKASAGKHGSSMLSLASAALYQQSSKSRALDLVRLAPGGSELWPGGSLSPGDGKANSPASLVLAIFQNRQDLADWWAQEELSYKKASNLEDGVFRARLLKLWCEGVDAAVACEAPDGDGVVVPAAWLFAALSPLAGEDAWAATLQELSVGAAKAGGGRDSVQLTVAAFLAADQDEEAIRVLLGADLLMDALLLSRLRLPEKHPMIGHIYTLLATDMQKRGRKDQAALCALATGCFGGCLTQLEANISAARSPALGPDPVRMASTFLAASIATKIASEYLLKHPLSECWTDTGEEGAHEYDASLCYDHKHWASKPALKMAVQASVRSLLEALHAGHLEAALATAQVRKTDTLSEGEKFVQTVLAGYCSAIGWWLQLRSSLETQGKDGDVSSALEAFVQRGQETVVPDDDWDFEWRMLTWLPCFDKSSDPLLVAAVELGRACASFASGATRATSGGEAPWEHIGRAVSVLVGTDSIRGSPCAWALKALGQLARRFDGSEGKHASGLCVDATASLAAGLSGWSESTDVGKWCLLNGVLFGLTTDVVEDACDGVACATLALRRWYGVAKAVRPSFDLMEGMRALAARRDFSDSQQLEMCRDLEAALVRSIEGCGFIESAWDSSPLDDTEGYETRLLSRVEEAQSFSRCLLFVPFIVSTWCGSLLERRVVGDSADAEYDFLGGGNRSGGREPSQLLASVLRGCEKLFEDDVCTEMQAEDDLESIEALKALESTDKLALDARLELLRLSVPDFDESLTNELSQEGGPAAVVFALVHAASRQLRRQPAGVMDRAAAGKQPDEEDEDLGRTAKRARPS